MLLAFRLTRATVCKHTWVHNVILLQHDVPPTCYSFTSINPDVWSCLLARV